MEIVNQCPHFGNDNKDDADREDDLKFGRDKFHDVNS